MMLRGSERLLLLTLVLGEFASPTTTPAVVLSGGRPSNAARSSLFNKDVLTSTQSDSSLGRGLGLSGDSEGASGVPINSSPKETAKAKPSFHCEAHSGLRR